MIRLLGRILLASLALLLVPGEAAAQIPFLQYGAKRVFREFGRGVQVRRFVLRQAGPELARYNRIEVARFDNEILELMPDRMDDELASEIVHRLEKEKQFRQVALSPLAPSPASPGGHFTFDPAFAEQSPRTLLVNGSIRDFYGGSEALRALNMGLRGLSVIVQVRLQDKATGEELYREQIVVVVDEVHGDAYRTALKAVAKGVAQSLYQQRQERSHGQPDTD